MTSGIKLAIDELVKTQQAQNEILIAIYRELAAKNAPKPKEEDPKTLLSVGNTQIQKLLKRQKEQIRNKKN